LPFQVQIDRPISDVALGPNGESAVLGVDDGRVLLWRFEPGDVRPLERHTDMINRVVMSPTGDRVATASLESVRLTALADGSSVALGARGGFIVDVAFSPDGERLVTGSSQGAAHVWSRRGDLVASLRHDGAVTRVTFSPDGRRILTASADATAKLWDAATAQVAAVLQHAGEVNVANFSPRGDRIVTAAEGDGLRLWAGDGKTVQALSGVAPADRVLEATFSPDGTRILAALTRGVLLWPSVEASPIEFAGDEEVSRVEWASNDLVVTASLNGEASLWGADGRRVATLALGADPLTRATLTSNGRYLLAASINGIARAWPVSTDLFRARLANTAFPCLAARDWEDFFLVDPAEAQARSRSCESGSRGGAF
jgi:WD40 repeat protein